MFDFLFGSIRDIFLICLWTKIIFEGLASNRGPHLKKVLVCVTVYIGSIFSIIVGGYV